MTSAEYDRRFEESKGFFQFILPSAVALPVIGSLCWRFMQKDIHNFWHVFVCVLLAIPAFILLINLLKFITAFLHLLTCTIMLKFVDDPDHTVPILDYSIWVNRRWPFRICLILAMSYLSSFPEALFRGVFFFLSQSVLLIATSYVLQVYRHASRYGNRVPEINSRKLRRRYEWYAE